MTIKTPILPSKQQFVKRANQPHELDLEAICVFMATGFFMGGDTYWKDEVCLLPGHNHIIDDEGFLVNSKPWFHWHYTPRAITFEDTLEEYIQLLTTITKEQVGDNPVILPLSGGLDSRSQALILKDLPNPVHGYSYSFQGGFAEHEISKDIAQVCGFSFSPYIIQPGYLWDCIDDLAQINGCYSEFTHPRQMAVLPQLKAMDGVFSLGHWGDVLFDRGAPEQTTEADIIPLLFKKMVKPKGLELAEQLWQHWDLAGDFTSYLMGRIESDLSAIAIDNVSAKVRAFKTRQWAHRWTTTNLSVFAAAHPISLPYYDDRMLQFICTVPEAYLADRRLQIAHLQQDAALSRIVWQDHRPFNLQYYGYNKAPYNLPYRVWHKLQREVQAVMGRSYVQRNWELQFVGAENETALKRRLFQADFHGFIPEALVQDTYAHFLKTDPVHYAHPLSMLLTLSLWHENNFKDL